MARRSRRSTGPAAGPPDTELIGLHLARVAKTVSRAFDAALTAAGGPLPMWLILVSVKRGVHGAQRELADAIGSEGATLTHHLNKMEAAALLQPVIAFDQRLRAGFNDRDLKQLERLLDRLVANTVVDDGDS